MKGFKEGRETAKPRDMEGRKPTSPGEKAAHAGGVGAVRTEIRGGILLLRRLRGPSRWGRREKGAAVSA